MRIARAAKTGRLSRYTDAKDAQTCAFMWERLGGVVFDATIDKGGRRHSKVTVFIEPEDIMALMNALIGRYQKENDELKKKLARYERPG